MSHMYVCMNISIHVCMNISIHTYMHIQKLVVGICNYMYKHIHVDVTGRWLRVCMYVCIYIYICFTLWPVAYDIIGVPATSNKGFKTKFQGFANQAWNPGAWKLSVHARWDVTPCWAALECDMLSSFSLSHNSASASCRTMSQSRSPAATGDLSHFSVQFLSISSVR